ncbi:MAG: protein kinase [Muribaculaceae bacterium]|nr:protein kinase [Muribaculaceae bacterium]
MTENKWTEIEHLPDWDDEIYDVYTAKKFGKWLMLKTLKEQYRDNPEYREMFEKEFDARYNLAHPHIVMINDFEEVPGLGLCIITDDVYGDSLRKLIDSGKVTDAHIEKVTHQLVDAMEYIQSNHIVHHPIRPENIIFTENIGNLKLINVGIEQKAHLTPDAVSEDIFNFGLMLTEMLRDMPNSHRVSHLRCVALKCTDPNPEKRYHDIQSLKLALDENNGNGLVTILSIFLMVMIMIIAYLTIKIK